MAIVVEAKESKRRYLLLGTAFANLQMFEQDPGQPHRAPLGGMVALCDQYGNIGWTHASNVRVIEIDGRSPNEFELSVGTVEFNEGE